MVTVELRRSGFAQWTYEAAVDGSNVLTHVFVFRCGWTLHIYANGRHRKVRYRRKADALADIDRQRALAAAIPPPEPTKRPTRGGSLRRPW